MGLLDLFRRETRGGNPYTDAIVAAAVEAATGKAATVNAVAAAECAAGSWSRAFASAVPLPEGLRSAALSADVLAMIGRELVLTGEAVFEVRTDGGLRLAPASEWSIYGEGLDEDAWLYDLSFCGPSGTTQRTVRGDRVLHVRYGVRPGEPWRGVSPLAAQRDSAQLLANMELRLKQEANASSGRVIPTPQVSAEDLTTIKANLKNLRGGSLLVPTTASSWGGQPGDAPRSDWVSRRVGLDPPEAVVNLRDSTAVAVLSACGIPPAMVSRSDGTALRESWRQFLFGVVSPVARLVALQCGRVLDVPLRFEFDELRASDLAGRARAFKQLREAGLDADRAAEIAGFG